LAKLHNSRNTHALRTKSFVLHILHLEDDPFQRDLARQALSSVNYHVTSCSKLEEAMECLSLNEFSVALVDLKLEAGSGIEIVREIVRRDLQTKVVIHTGNACIQSALEGIELRVFAYVDKSDGLDHLTSHIVRANAAYLKDSLSFAQNESQLQVRLLDSLQNGVIATNLNLNVIYANQNACVLLSKSRREMLGESASSWFEVVRGGLSNHPTPLETQLTNFDWNGHWVEEVYLAQHAPSRPANDSDRNGLSQRVFRLSVSPIGESLEEISGYILLFVDITQEKQAEKRLQNAIQLANHAQRVATLGQMTAILAHELNHPLAAISNYAGGLMLDRAPPGPTTEVSRVLQLIQDQSLRAGKIIQNLRSFVSPGTSHHESLRINEVIEHAILMVEVEFRSCQVEIELRLESTLPMVLGNKILLSQVFVNILRNAFEAMDSAESSTRKVIVKSGQTDSNVYIEIEDQGPGVSPEMLATLFIAYSSTKSGGLGLGLAISRSIVDQHHGTIVAKNRVLGGLSLLVTMPCA